MSLEAANFVSDLVTTNPPGTDLRSQGDDHIRLIKTVLKSTFPNAMKPFSFPDAATKVAAFTIGGAEQNKIFYVNTSGGVINATLPSLTATDAGWECTFVKTTADVNPVFVLPPTGTIQSGAYSGLAKARRCIPGVRFRAHWSGSAWFVDRIVNAPVGGILDFDGATVPVGFELPNGQTLAGSGGSLYPEYFLVKGSLATRDLMGRVVVMKEASATRLTTAGSGVDGATLGAVGGLETHTLTVAQLAAHGHAGSTASSSVTDPGHIHSYGETLATRTGGAQGGAGAFQAANNGTDTLSATTGISVSTTVSIANAGSGSAHNNAQPTIVLNKLLVVE